MFLILGAVISCQSVTNSFVEFEEYGKKIGALGPIIINLRIPVEQKQFTNGIHISPKADLDFQFNENELEIRPKSFFIADKDYQLSLSLEKTNDEEPATQNDYIWDFKTRSVCLIYLSSPILSPEIWRYCFDGQVRTQLSHTNGQVQYFNPSSDGNWIIYSTLNEKGVTDLWIMDRDGKQERNLYSCGMDTCIDTNFIFGGKKIIFVRIPKNTLITNTSNEILIMDISSRQITTLMPDEKIQPSFLDASKDDKYISFFDQTSSSFWIWNVEKQSFTKIPSDSGLGGSWSRQSGEFTYSQMVFWGGIPYGEINRWNPVTGSIESLFGGKEELNEYFLPQWRPQGDWLAAVYRPIEGSASKQIILLSKDVDGKIAVTIDQSYSYSSFSWSFDGEMIAYQRFQLGIPGSVPEIGVWRMSDQLHVIIEKNASSPKWIP